MFSSTSNNPRNFTMTLDTARTMVAKPHEFKEGSVAEARRVVAYWAKRNAKKRAA